MDFQYSEDQQALAALARQILGDRATHERADAIEASEAGCDLELWKAFARADLIGACLPERAGGQGLGLFELGILCEEVGRAVAPLPLWPTLALAALPICDVASADQRRRWLPAIIAGDAIWTGGFEEFYASDPREPVTRARALPSPGAGAGAASGDAGGGYALDGTKACVPLAHIAERVLVAASADLGIGLFALDPRAAGVTMEIGRSTNAEPAVHLRLDDARVAAEDVLLAPGPEGGAALTRIVDRAIAGLCALAVGVADRALRMTAAYTGERKQFDRPVGSFQAVHQRAGDAYVSLEAMRLTTLRALHKLERGEPATREVSVAKYWAARGGNDATYAAQHLHGGIGMDRDYPLYRSYLWNRHIELTLGGAAKHLERIGDGMRA